jgi:hypothetical protein
LFEFCFQPTILGYSWRWQLQFYNWTWICSMFCQIQLQR